MGMTPSRNVAAQASGVRAGAVCLAAGCGVWSAVCDNCWCLPKAFAFCALSQSKARGHAWHEATTIWSKPQPGGKRAQQCQRCCHSCAACWMSEPAHTDPLAIRLVRCSHGAALRSYTATPTALATSGSG